MNFASYSVIVVYADRRGRTLRTSETSGHFLSQPGGSSKARSCVISRTRSARKLNEMTESPSRISPRGDPSGWTMTVGSMNSSPTFFAYDCFTASTPEVARVGGLAALKALGKAADVLRETKERLFAA